MYYLLVQIIVLPSPNRKTGKVTSLEYDPNIYLQVDNSTIHKYNTHTQLKMAKYNLKSTDEHPTR
uniref:Uncharacterized protein n=1 Tax=Rhizophora mucronata TaxID=61149 RepID=A0A2P2PY11_RHIMU